MTTENLLRHLDEEKIKEKKLHDRINAVASIYLVMFEIDLINDTYTVLKSKNYVDNIIEAGTNSNCQEVLKRVMSNLANEATLPEILDFIDFSTLNERLAEKNTITQEFQGTVNNKIWARARFIVIDRQGDGTLSHILWTVESIDAEKKEREKLQKAAEISEAASHAKSAFLANMSHEIRTPINAILGMNEMMLREADSPALQEYAKNIKSAGNALLSIINDILDFSKIEAGKLELAPQEYDLSSIIIDIVNMSKSRADEKNLEFNINVEPTIPKNLYGDNIRIKQCILNLITNAIKYTQKGSFTLSLSHKKIDDETIALTVKVSDTGIGIKTEDIDKIFSPFDRVEEVRNKTIEGTGLGLSIVQSILALMNSRLFIKSEYNVGSEFSFTINQKVINSEEIGFIDYNQEKSDSLETYKEKLHAPNAHILFVDDTQINLDVVSGLLKRTGIQIDTATSGMGALRKVCENKYDIIFIDHRMPGMDGIETLEAMNLLSENLNKGKPCIALTANAIQGSREMYLKSGFTDYLSKPVNPDKLEELIRKYLPDSLIEKTSEIEIQPEEKPNLDTKNIKGIDIKKALENCGERELLDKMFCQFHDSINQKSSELENYLKENDFENYRIKIHALKSTARLIGALSLSEKAELLEHAADSGNIQFIKEHNPSVMVMYREYLENLKDYTENIQSDINQNENADISAEKFKELLSSLINGIEDYDYDRLEKNQEDFEKFNLPLDFSSIYAKIKEYIYNVDFDKLKEMLPEIKKLQEKY